MKDMHLPALTRAELIDLVEDLRQQLITLEAAPVSETRYQVLLDESSAPIFMFGPDGQYRYVKQKSRFSAKIN